MGTRAVVAVCLLVKVWRSWKVLVCLWKDGTSRGFHKHVVLHNTRLEPQLRAKNIVVQYEDFDVTVVAQTPSQGS